MFRLLCHLLLVASLCSTLFGCSPPPTTTPKTGVTPLPSPAPVPGLFENVTESAGITFRHTNGDKSAFKYIEMFGGGCAFLDYDNDGYIDLLFVSPGNLGEDPKTAKPNLTLYHNDHNGKFTDVTKGSGLDVYIGYAQAVTVGDYDNDGRPDIFVAGYGGCKLFQNVTGQIGGGGGRQSYFDPKAKLFHDVTAIAGVADTELGARWASCAAFGDYDNDGKLDLYICHYAVWSPETDKKCPRPDGSPGYCVPTVYQGDFGTLYHNEGGGKFKNVTKQAGIDKVRGRGLAVTWIDYNDDGKPDIYIANDLDENHLLRNNGNGTFTEVGQTVGVALGIDGQKMSGMGIAVGDYDHSGRESLFVTNLNGEVYSLFHNEGGGQFSYASHTAGLRTGTITHSAWGTAFFDFDRDGWPDLITANGNVNPAVAQDLPGITYEEPKSLFHNLGNGSFEDVTAKSGAMTLPRASRGLAVGDFDNDGRLDVACVNRNERADLFRNVSQDKGHWVLLKLVGTKSNRDGAGAKVHVTAGGMKQYQECRLASTYAGCNDKRLFFGMGNAATLDTVEIRWPSGRMDVLKGLAADKVWTVTEGERYATGP